MTNAEIFSKKEECLSLLHIFFGIVQNPVEFSKDDLNVHNNVYSDLALLLEILNEEINKMNKESERNDN